MTTTEDHTYEADLKRKRDSSPHVESQEEAGNESQFSTFSIDEEISCGICLGVLESPYTVIPCLHTFDKDCLVGWWQNNNTCPLCKTTATSGRHSFQLQAIINHYDEKRPAHKRARAPEGIDGGRDADKGEIYPFGVAPPPAPANHNHNDEEDEEDIDLEEDEDEDEDEDDGDDGDLMVGGRLVFPCPACSPGHPSGYTCPIPIPEPTDAAKVWEAREYMNLRRPIVHPGRGQTRVALALGLHELPYPQHPMTDEVRAEIGRACAEHIACTNCSSYIPRDWPRRNESTCQICSRATCAPFDPLGCPVIYGQFTLAPFNEAGTAINTFTLWDIISRANHHFRANVIERTRFTDRLTAHNITPSTIAQELLQSAGHGAEHYFCTWCVGNLVGGEFATWWRTKKESGTAPVAAEVARLNDCWYGRDCRTQSHNAGHASRFNHDCDPRPAQAQAQAQAPAPAPAPADPAVPPAPPAPAPAPDLDPQPQPDD